jgi:hypothetical protein
MRSLSLTTLLLAISHFITSASIPQSSNSELIARESSAELITPSNLDARSFAALTKRKGGGGGGSGGGSGGGGGGRSSGGSSGGGGGRSGGGSSGGSRSGSSSSGGISSSGRVFSFSPSSSAGGRTRSGSGPPPRYGNSYAGGASVPYTAGQRSPTRGINPNPLPIAAFAFFPGIWLYGSLHAYPYGTTYHYRNSTGQNATVDVTCLCQKFSVCSCDDNGNSTYMQQLVGNGTNQPVNTSDVVVLPQLANGTQRAYVNGTLPNGTTADGGTDPSSDEQVSAAIKTLVVNYGGYWILAATVAATVLAL